MGRKFRGSSSPRIQLERFAVLGIVPMVVGGGSEGEQASAVVYV